MSFYVKKRGFSIFYLLYLFDIQSLNTSLTIKLNYSHSKSQKRIMFYVRERYFINQWQNLPE